MSSCKVSSRLRQVLLCGILFASSNQQANAMAYCALRDPVNTIYELFPGAGSYRSSVRTVDRKARQAVLDRLPFSLHFNELGRHTLYVAQLGESKALGFVHARSELEEWGITEYAWALSPKLEVVGVKVQRSRDPINKTLVSTPQYTRVIGKDLLQLIAQYKVAQESGNVRLASFIASALKSIVITRSVWRDEVDAAALLGVVEQVFPGAANMRAIGQLLPEQTLHQLADIEMQSSPIFDRKKLQGSLVLDSTDSILGVLLEVPFADGEQERMLWWFVSRDGQVRRVVDQSTLASDSDFSSVVGISPPLELSSCSTLADLAALELTTIARAHTGLAVN